jgi:ABC-type multidrug transport system fused ATPase/permease subunit
MATVEHPSWYPYALFIAFCLFRLIAIVLRNYYDLHVYNYFKYVENAIKAQLYTDVQRFKQWQMQENKRAAILNILTKDSETFVTGSWQFPYLVVVPVNTLISICILYNMFGPIILLSYLAMIGLLVLQYWSNKWIADLQYALKKQTDSRIQLISQVLSGIRQIKCRVLEHVFAGKIGVVRAKEIQSFTSYVNIKNICGAIYANAGVIISSLIFLFADKNLLELGKVFSTLALLGYIFNFSIVYSNYAIEAIYQIKVFNQRVTDIVTSTIKRQAESERSHDAHIIDEGAA